MRACTGCTQRSNGIIPLCDRDEPLGAEIESEQLARLAAIAVSSHVDFVSTGTLTVNDAGIVRRRQTRDDLSSARRKIQLDDLLWHSNLVR